MIPMAFTLEEVNYLAEWSKRLPQKRPLVKRPEYVDCLLQVRETFMASERLLFICNVITQQTEARRKTKNNLKGESVGDGFGRPSEVGVCRRLGVECHNLSRLMADVVDVLKGMGISQNAKTALATLEEVSLKNLNVPVDMPTHLLLERAMTWGETPQGHSFWWEIQTRLIKKSKEGLASKEAIMKMRLIATYEAIMDDTAPMTLKNLRLGQFSGLHSDTPASDMLRTVFIWIASDEGSDFWETVCKRFEAEEEETDAILSAITKVVVECAEAYRDCTARHVSTKPNLQQVKKAEPVNMQDTCKTRTRHETVVMCGFCVLTQRATTTLLWHSSHRSAGTVSPHTG